MKITVDVLKSKGIAYVERFEYADLSKASKNGKRHYQTPDGRSVPSVTTVLSATKDMTHLNGTKLIDGLGGGATDKYGLGYDVMTSAQVDEFGTGSGAKRVYYEGDHDDFIDTDDKILVSRENGTVTMSAAKISGSDV